MKNYLNKDDFTFELTICKGRGKVSAELSHMFWLISTRLIKKPQFYIVDLHDDQIMEAYTRMFEVWKGVNIDKYEQTLLPYFTEIAKRSFVKIFNLYKDRTAYNDAPHITSLTTFENWN